MFSLLLTQVLFLSSNMEDVFHVVHLLMLFLENSSFYLIFTFTATYSFRPKSNTKKGWHALDQNKKTNYQMHSKCSSLARCNQDNWAQLHTKSLSPKIKLRNDKTVIVLFYRRTFKHDSNNPTKLIKKVINGLRIMLAKDIYVSNFSSISSYT